MQQLFRAADVITTFALDSSGTEDQLVMVTPNGELKRQAQQDSKRKAVIAGSAAVRILQSAMRRHARLLDLDVKAVFNAATARSQLNWRPNDCDMFLLAHSKPGCIKIATRNIARISDSPEAAELAKEWAHILDIDKTDLVRVPYTSVAELLLGFDLACCRAALDKNGTIWTTWHCLAAILSGKYAVPSEMATPKQCAQFILRQVSAPAEPSESLKNFVYRMTMRFQQRTSKYAQQRGFVPQFILKNIVPSWIRHRLLRWYDNPIPQAVEDTERPGQG